MSWLGIVRVLLRFPPPELDHKLTPFTPAGGGLLRPRMCHDAMTGSSRFPPLSASRSRPFPGAMPADPPSRDTIATGHTSTATTRMTSQGAGPP